MLKKIVLAIALLVFLLIAGAAAFLATLPSSRPASGIAIEPTPARLARGEYLAEHVTPCFACHSRVDTSRWAMPRVGLDGGECWTEEIGFPGHVCAPNLTPDVATGLGEWTDGEILRAMREGVHREGYGLFPNMPYSEFRHLSDEDATAIVAYLRTLEPVSYPRPRRNISFPASLATRFAPQPLEGPVTAPDPSDTVAYGGYLAKVAGCQFCHTPLDESMAPVPGMEFAGGHEFPLPDGGLVVSSNITPHATGIGLLTRENFIGLFRAYADQSAVAVEAPPGYNTMMPWYIYAGMTDGDLGAIYDYLQTVAPADNVVNNWPRLGQAQPAGS